MVVEEGSSTLTDSEKARVSNDASDYDSSYSSSFDSDDKVIVDLLNEKRVHLLLRL